MIKSAQHFDRRKLFSLINIKGVMFAFSTFIKAILKNKVLCNSIRIGVFFIILLLMIQKLSLIGWEEIYRARPTSPLFYFLSIALFLVPISADMLACRLIIGSKIPNWFRIYARKRVYNEVVLSYLGEAYLIKKIGKLPGLDLHRAAIAIKDQAIIRTFIANAWLIILVALIVIMGKSNVLSNFAVSSPTSAIFIGLICIGVCTFFIVFFRKLSRLSMNTTLKVAAIYLLKVVLVLCIYIAQWSLAIPGTSVSTWLLFLVIFLLSKKSPFSGELVFISIILAMPNLNIDTAAVAAMLITAAAINQLVFLTMFIVTFEFSATLRLKTLVQPKIKSIQSDSLEASEDKSIESVNQSIDNKNYPKPTTSQSIHHKLIPTRITVLANTRLAQEL